MLAPPPFASSIDIVQELLDLLVAFLAPMFPLFRVFKIARFDPSQDGVGIRDRWARGGLCDNSFDIASLRLSS